MPCPDPDEFEPLDAEPERCKFCDEALGPPERHCGECGGGCFACVTEQCSCCCRWFCIGCMEEDRRCGECVEANKEEASEQERQ